MLPSRRMPSSAAIRQNSMSSPTSTAASAASGLPWSSVLIRASSSLRRSQTSAMRWSIAARSNGVRASQAGNAARAASIARCASARSPHATSPSDSPVAGLVASMVRPDAASHHSPSMSMRVGMRRETSQPLLRERLQDAGPRAAGRDLALTDLLEPMRVEHAGLVALDEPVVREAADHHDADEQHRAPLQVPVERLGGVVDVLARPGQVDRHEDAPAHG